MPTKAKTPCRLCGGFACTQHKRPDNRNRQSGWQRYDATYRKNRALVLARCTPDTPCGLCHRPLGRDETQWSTDHIKPVSKGGSDDAWNLRPTHLSCNSRRGNR